MSDAFVQVTPDGTGKKIDTAEVVVGANTVERQRIINAGENAATKFDVTTAGTPAGVTVGTSAVLLAASNTARKSIIIANAGEITLYIGHTSGVTAGGAASGIPVPPGGVYSDSGFGLYIGDLYGRCASASSIPPNVVVSERT